MRSARQTVLLAVSMLPTIAMAQSFSFLSQERSVYGRVSSFTDQKSSTSFGVFDQRAQVIFGNAGAGSLQQSTLSATAITLFGDIGASNSPVLFTQARGVFDVSFTLTQATDVRLFYVINEYWNFTIWTPTGSQVLASGGIASYYDDKIVNLAAGEYRLRADADVTNGQSGNITVEMTIVPAPSGAVLAACVGLVACHRRRR